MKSSDVVRALAPADQAGEDEPLSALMYPLRFLGIYYGWFQNCDLIISD